jgi:RimJ/RimL family protein N-acetyltransferase
MTDLDTARLVLRNWRGDDRDRFAVMNADPIVMQHFPSTLTVAESNAFVDRMRAHLDEHGWGLWAVEVRDDASFIGFVGLWPIGVDPFADQRLIEVGWRLTQDAWGHGYATEGARASLDHGFTILGLEQVVSYTAATNSRSRAVMERVGMRFDREFEHPRIDPGHPLRTHVIYRISAAAWAHGADPEES